MKKHKKLFIGLIVFIALASIMYISYINSPNIETFVYDSTSGLIDLGSIHNALSFAITASTTNVTVGEKIYILQGQPNCTNLTKNSLLIWYPGITNPVICSFPLGGNYKASILAQQAKQYKFQYCYVCSGNEICEEPIYVTPTISNPELCGTSSIIENFSIYYQNSNKSNGIDKFAYQTVKSYASINSTNPCYVTSKVVKIDTVCVNNYVIPNTNSSHIVTDFSSKPTYCVLENPQAITTINITQTQTNNTSSNKPVVIEKSDYTLFIIGAIVSLVAIIYLIKRRK